MGMGGRTKEGEKTLVTSDHGSAKLVSKGFSGRARSAGEWRGLYGDGGLLASGYGGSRDGGLYGDGGCLQCLDGGQYGDGGLLIGLLRGDYGHRTILLHRRRGCGFHGGLQKVMGQWIWLR